MQTPHHLKTYILHSKINQQSLCFVRKTCSMIITANVSRYNIACYFNIMKNINYHKKTFELYKQSTRNKTIFFYRSKIKAHHHSNRYLYLKKQKLFTYPYSIIKQALPFQTPYSYRISQPLP